MKTVMRFHVGILHLFDEHAHDLLVLRGVRVLEDHENESDINSCIGVVNGFEQGLSGRVLPLTAQISR